MSKSSRSRLAGASWSFEEIDQLKNLAARRLRVTTIAETLNRTEAAVRGKAIALGVQIVSNRAPIALPLKFSARQPTDGREVSSGRFDGL